MSLEGSTIFLMPPLVCTSQDRSYVCMPCSMNNVFSFHAIIGICHLTCLRLAFLFYVTGSDLIALEAQLDLDIAMYRGHTFAESTKKTYDSHRRSYLQFCHDMGYPPVPISRIQLARYTAHLAKRLKPQSISKYLNIVRLLHLEADLPNPLQENWLLQSLLKGITRVKGASVQKKLP